MRLVALAGLINLFLLSSSPARASGPPCNGKLRLDDCSEPHGEVVWPLHKPPTFSITCIVCDTQFAIPTDAAPTCWTVSRKEDLEAVPLRWRNSLHWSFTVTIDSQHVSSSDSDVQSTDQYCEGERVQRYTAPLRPGGRYEIEYPGQTFPRTVVRFRVADAPDAGPDVGVAGPDAGVAGPDVGVAAPAAGPADAGAAPDAFRATPASRGCSAGRRPTPGAGTLLLAVALALAPATFPRKRARGRDRCLARRRDGRPQVVTCRRGRRGTWSQRHRCYEGRRRRGWRP